MTDLSAFDNLSEQHAASLKHSEMRTLLYVPLIQGDRAIGTILVGSLAVDDFSKDDIPLLETFAAQAVIAIENVRQFRELQTKLEQEAATGNLLSVISKSRDDDTHVFNTVVELAAQVCGADQAGLTLLNADGRDMRLMANWGHVQTTYAVGSEFSIDAPLSAAIAIRESRIVIIDDLAQSELYLAQDPVIVQLVDVEGIRTRLTVPILEEGRAIGAIMLSRREVRPFNPSEIQLVEKFAQHAVIAIENTKQFHELQTRLAREGATREVLEVISHSRSDETPVFNTILENTARLCETNLATLNLINETGTHLEYAAHIGDALPTYEVGEDRWSLDSTLQIAESVRRASIIHNVDLRQTDLYVQGDKWRRQLVDDEGVRTFLTVPLLSADGKPVGCVGLYRKEVRAFTDDEVSLVEGFAAQAVIAIENTRQLRELHMRLTREQATGEILSVISQSRDDEKPVFDSILQNACALCNAQQAALVLGTAEDEIQTLAAHKDAAQSAVDLFDAGKMPMDGNISYAARSIIESRLISFDDMEQSDLYTAGSPVVRSMVDDSNIRSVLFVPLLKNGNAIGTVTLFRYEVSPFNDFEISLVETFAAQAVIAIENVRQFRELQNRLQREAATKQILHGISQSRDDEQPVFDLIVELAKELCG
ncbi:MAG: GAF domain-containing protein, partial [Rhodobacteraceae bacterium]|nr:GAF domain-containing protein [Paracoccaceae bacterium]